MDFTSTESLCLRLSALKWSKHVNKTESKLHDFWEPNYKLSKFLKTKLSFPSDLKLEYAMDSEVLANFSLHASFQCYDTYLSNSAAYIS